MRRAPCLPVFLAAAFWLGGTAAALAADPPKSPPAQTGVASYFGPELNGKTTASGETVKPGALTAASPTLPFGTTAKVTATETGKSVHVTVTDRGPYANGRILDVSPEAAERLGMKDDGVAKVTVQPLRRPAPQGDRGN